MRREEEDDVAQRVAHALLIMEGGAPATPGVAVSQELDPPLASGAFNGRSNAEEVARRLEKFGS